MIEYSYVDELQIYYSMCGGYQSINPNVVNQYEESNRSFRLRRESARGVIIQINSILIYNNCARRRRLRSKNCRSRSHFIYHV